MYTNPSPEKTYSKRNPLDPNGPPPSFDAHGPHGHYRAPTSKEETDQYGWWMSSGKPPKKPNSQRSHSSRWAPPLPWQVDPEGHPEPSSDQKYREWYDAKTGAEKEYKPELPKSVPAQVSEMVKKHMEMVKKKLSKLGAIYMI